MKVKATICTEALGFRQHLWTTPHKRFNLNKLNLPAVWMAPAKLLPCQNRGGTTIAEAAVYKNVIGRAAPANLIILGAASISL